MKATKMSTILVLALGLMVWLVGLAEAEPMGTAWTYQGRLIDANAPAEGLYDFQFKLYDDANTITGNQLGSAIDVNDLDVLDGYFTVELNFGSGVFDGNDRWLEIDVRAGESNDPNAFVSLSPRQEVTPTPYALQTRGIFVDDAGNVGIGTTSPISRLEVMATENQHGIRSTVPRIAVYGRRTGTSGTWPGVHGECDSLSSNASGVRGIITSTSPGTNSAGVRGTNNGTGATGAGVYGWQAGDGYGVYGNTAGNGIGVRGVSSGSNGVSGSSTSGNGVFGSSTSSNGVFGVSTDSYGVYGLSDSSYGVYGYSFNDYGVYGYSSNDYGVYGKGYHGVYGEGFFYGVHGESTYFGVYGHSNTETGVYGSSDSGNGVHGYSNTGYAGHFTGNVYVTNNVSALSFTDRTAYPKDLATAYQAVMSMERLGDGQYDENSKEVQLDHSKLSDFVKSKDGNRDLSATVSAINEVVKDLIRKVEAQQQLIEIQNAQIQQMVKTLQTNKHQPQIGITKGAVQ